jgi:hypothetical protein
MLSSGIAECLSEQFFAGWPKIRFEIEFLRERTKRTARQFVLLKAPFTPAREFVL